MAYGKLKADAIIYDNSGTDVEKTIAQIIADPEGTVIKSTGESGTTKFLRVDGDGTCSWQVPPDTTYSVQDGQLSQNSFTNADHSKLNAIEASATADQTAAEIRTLVESATDSNVFTDADHTKLNAIEASATADQTASEIRALVESASDSNVFTDADHTKLNGVATSANNYTHPNHSGEVTSSADGAQTIADNVVDEANLKVSNSPTNGQFLSAQSGNTGGLTWATATGTTINNNSDSRVITGSSTANTLNAKSDLTWNGNILTATADSSSDAEIKLISDTGTNNADYWKLQTSQSDHYFRIYDYGQGSWIERLKIDAAGKLYATTFQGIGTDLTSLNATNLGSGTVPTARVSGAYTGITGLGTLSSIITSGPFTENENHLANNTPVINCSLGNYFTIDISSNCTFSFTNEPSNTVSYGCVVEVVHSGGTISWPSELKWSTDAAPSLTTGKTHLFFFTTNDAGSRWRGAYQVDYTN